jgi:hypothetical protein
MVCIGKILGMSIGNCDRGSSKVEIKATDTSINNLNNSLKSLQTQDTSVALNQIQNVSVTGNCCQPLIISQNLKAIVVDDSKMNISFMTQIAMNLTRDINKTMENSEVDLNNKFGGNRGTNLKVSVENALKKMNSKSAIANIIQEKVSKTLASQGQRVYITCGEELKTPPPPPSSNLPDTGCYVTQDFIFSQTTNNIMEAVFSALSLDDGIINAVKDIRQSENITEEKTIVFSPLTTFLGVPKNVAKIIGIIVGIFTLFIFIIKIIFRKKK